jgi:hypothetical protein
VLSLWGTAPFLPLLAKKTSAMVRRQIGKRLAANKVEMVKKTIDKHGKRRVAFNLHLVSLLLLLTASWQIGGNNSV